MLILDVKNMMKARGIGKPFAFLRDSGLPAGAAQKIMSGAYERPSLNHIEQLCILLQCTPNDLLLWVPDEGQHADIPLGALQQQDEDLSFLATLQDLPIDQLRELGKQLRTGK
jgi:DNA-binding Xre family transcriptional regulator